MTKTITKTEFVEKLAEKLGTSKLDANKTLTAMFGTVEECLKAGMTVRLTGFGRFAVTETKARTMPSFGKKEVKVPAGKRISFKAGAELKAAVN